MMRVITPKLILVTGLLLLAGAGLRGQHMIDRTKEEVLVLVKDNYKEFRSDKSVVNQRFNYLKYVNGLRTRTWIIYFTDADICRSTKMVCDYGEFDKVLDELNQTYEKVGESEWAYELAEDTVHLTLVREEWYFTVREARKK
jgi:hypothetical protein